MKHPGIWDGEGRDAPGSWLRRISPGALPETTRVNIGCGLNPIPGYLNVDHRAGPGVDVVWNVEDIPWPWHDETFDVVAAHSVFEHVWDLVPIVHECHRVLKPGGILWIRVPHGIGAIYQVGHIHAFNKNSFHLFTAKADASLEAGEYFRMEARWISNRAIPLAATLKRRLPRLYRRLVDNSDYDHRERSKLPIGMRIEISFVLRKVIDGQRP